MQLVESITKQKTAVASRFAGLRPGDHVFVYDGVKERNIWCEIAATKAVEGRLKIRIKDANFFFDESLVISFAVNQNGADVRPAPAPEVDISGILDRVSIALHDARLRLLVAICRLSEGTFDETALTCVRRNFEGLRTVLDDALAGLDVEKESPRFTLTAPDDRMLFQRLERRLAHANRIAQQGVTEATADDLRSTLDSALDEAKLLLRAAAWREEIKP